MSSTRHTRQALRGYAKHLQEIHELQGQLKAAAESRRRLQGLQVGSSESLASPTRSLLSFIKADGHFHELQLGHNLLHGTTVFSAHDVNFVGIGRDGAALASPASVVDGEMPPAMLKQDITKLQSQLLDLQQASQTQDAEIERLRWASHCFCSQCSCLFLCKRPVPDDVAA